MCIADFLGLELELQCVISKITYRGDPGKAGRLTKNTLHSMVFTLFEQTLWWMKWIRSVISKNRRHNDNIMKLTIKFKLLIFNATSPLCPVSWAKWSTSPGKVGFHKNIQIVSLIQWFLCVYTLRAYFDKLLID